MKAYVLKNGELNVMELEDPTPKKDEVVVDLKVAGLNRRDLSLQKRVGAKSEPLVIGSDGAGVIAEVGADVKDVNVGDDVIINPSLRWNKNSVAPPKEFDILGFPDNGTIAEKIVIHQDQVEAKPSQLSWEESGVFALAALTGYRALVTKGEVEKGQTVFIPGAGSGVATYMIQYGKAKGARVIVSSRSEAKRKEALNLGADRAIDTNNDWTSELKEETIDLIIESVGDATFNRSLDVLKKGGRIVLFGATAGDTTELNLREFFNGQYQLIGTAMGSREEFLELLSFIEQAKIKPIISKTFPLNQVKDAFAYLEAGDQFGKIAITIND